MANPNPDMLPVDNATLPFWLTQPHELENHRSTPDLPIGCDIVIIGSGFAGAAVAHYLYDANPSSPCVLILEARTACSGATARNVGHVRPDVYFSVPGHAKRHGMKAAVDMARFQAKQVHAVKSLVERESIDCDFVLTRACDAILDPALAQDTDAAFEELKRQGVADLADVYHAKSSEAEGLSGVKGALSAIPFRAASLWPYKLMLHLLAGVVRKGAGLQTNTPVNEGV